MSYTLYNSIKRLVAVFLLLSVLLSFGGCELSIYSNYREISRLHVVQTLGMDKAATQLELTAATGAGSEEQPPLIISRKGESIVTTIEALQEYSPRDELYFPHIRYVLLGESAARQALPELLDYLERSASLRMDISLFVVKDGTAEALIAGSLEEKYDITACLSAIERDVARWGVGYVFNCRELARSLSEYGSGLIYAVNPSKTEGSVFSKSSELTATPAGYGIVRDGKLCSFMGSDLSLGANLLMNKPGTGALDLPVGKDALATVYMENGKTTYSALWGEDGSLRQIVADITVSSGLAAIDPSIKLDSPEVLEDLSAALAEKLKKNCMGTLALSQELEADFLGLMGYLRQKYPREVKALQGDFIGALKNAEFVVNAHTEIQRSYDLESPADTKGEGGKGA